MNHVKFRTVPLLLALLLAFAALPPAFAGFSSIYVFGDGVCTTTGNNTAGYHGNRFCNGKVWVEVLSDWQGVPYSAAKNVSDFGHDSVGLNASVTAFVAPTDAATSLFVVWCNDADFVNFTGDISIPYGSLPPWTSRMNQSIADHTTAIATLYDKGARMILAPGAVDIMQTPFYNFFDLEDRLFARNRVIEYNVLFKAAMDSLMASKPGLKILYADAFEFFDQVIADPAAYGLVNPYPYNAGSLDAVSGALNGDGALFVFWDEYHPTAKFQMHLADFFQKIVSPVKVDSLSMSGGTVQMQVSNIPLARAGSIQGSANLQPPWATKLTINESLVSGGSTTKSYSFPADGGKSFYRVGFPVVWTWP